MGVLIDCFQFQFEPESAVISIIAQQGCTVVSNKGLHPTKFTNPLLYKPKTFIIILVDEIYFILFIFFLSVVLLDVIVFTQLVCRSEQKQRCHFSSKAIDMVCPVN